MGAVRLREADSALAHLSGLKGLACAEFDCGPGRLAMPDFACDLIWRGGRLLVVGPMTTGLVMDSSHGRLALVTLGPVEARRLFGRPLSELTDRMVAIDDVAPHVANPLQDLFAMGQSARLVRGVDPAAMTSDQDQADPWAPAALRAFEAGMGSRRVAEMLDITPRHLRRLFRDASGLTPGEFGRIRRFRKAVAQARSGVGLAHCSYEAGYTDQAHFNRECRQFTGLTPRQVLASLGGGSEVVPVSRED